MRDNRCGVRRKSPPPVGADRRTRAAGALVDAPPHSAPTFGEALPDPGVREATRSPDVAEESRPSRHAGTATNSGPRVTVVNRESADRHTRHGDVEAQSP